MSTEFTEWVKAFIEWLEETGIMDALTDMLTEISVQSIYAFWALVISVIGSLAIGGVILTVGIVVAVVTAVVVITLYVLRAIGLCNIAKKLGVKNRFLAWIPYANAYVLGACAEQSARRNGKKPWKWGYILLFTTLGLRIGQPIVQMLIAIILTIFPMLSALIGLIMGCSGLILLVMTGYCLWCICKEFMDQTLAVIFAVLGPICKDAVAVLLFVVGFLRLRPAGAADTAPKVTESAASMAAPALVGVEKSEDRDAAAVIAAESDTD